MRQTLIFIAFFITTTSVGQAVLTKEDRLKEVALIKSAWTALHPGLLRYNSQVQIDEYFSILEKEVSKPISKQDYFILLSQLAAKIKCGHTYLNPWNQSDETRRTCFSNICIPFLFKVINRKFIITHNLSENKTIKAGDEIVSINGIKVNRIIDSLLSVSRADGDNGLAKKLDNINIVVNAIDSTNFSFFDIYFPLFFKNNFNVDKYALEIKPYKKKIINTTVKSLTKALRHEKYVSLFGEIPIQEKNWEYKILQPHIAYLRIGDFDTWEWQSDYTKYLDSVFTSMNAMHLPNLIIDIRGNEGGDDDARTEVLSYIADKPFGCETLTRRLYKYLVIPDTLLPYLKTWDPEFKAPRSEKEYALNGNYYEKIDTLKKPCQPNLPKNNRFKGNVYLITNPTNSSTTFTMADIFKIYQFGTIVGEPTGGTKQGLNGGQFFFLELPFSKFEIDLPIMYGAPSGHRADEAIMPDFLITTQQSDIYYNRDPQIEYIIQKIK
jgi:C-terminal processing protease CtpA/Prc